MHHGPAAKLGKDNATDWKSSLGVKLFIVYGLIYAGFIGINLYSPKLMAKKIMLGQNLAVIYGMGLIVLAIVMGLVYNHLCTQKEYEMNKPEAETKENN